MVCVSADNEVVAVIMMITFNGNNRIDKNETNDFIDLRVADMFAAAAILVRLFGS